MGCRGFSFSGGNFVAAVKLRYIYSSLLLAVLPRMFPGFISLYIYKGGDRNAKEDSNSNEPLSLVFLPDTHSNVNLLWPPNCHLVPKFQFLQGITAMWLHVS